MWQTQAWPSMCWAGEQSCDPQSQSATRCLQWGSGCLPQCHGTCSHESVRQGGSRQAGRQAEQSQVSKSVGQFDSQAGKADNASISQPVSQFSQSVSVVSRCTSLPVSWTVSQLVSSGSTAAWGGMGRWVDGQVQIFLLQIYKGRHTICSCGWAGVSCDR